MAGSRMELVMDRYQRAIVGVVYPLAIVALAVVPWLVTAGDLPHPIAVHFAADGRANGSMPALGEVVLLVLLSGVPAVALARMVRHPSTEHVVSAPIAAFVGLVSGTLWLFTAVANRGHDDWHEVHLRGGYVAGSLVGSVCAVLPITLLARRRAAAEDALVDRPALQLDAGERVAWFGGARSYPFLVGGCTFLVAAAVVALRSAATLGLAATFAVVGVAFLAFATVHVSVGRGGVRVRSGPFGWPSVRFGLAQIESAAAVDVKPLGMGGWGYRGSVRVFGRASWTLRGGPGLELHLTGGRRFAVTVDDPDQAAAVVNGLLARGG
jgi:hypothetical protein